jgi:hypothetical protein
MSRHRYSDLENIRKSTDPRAPNCGPRIERLQARDGKTLGVPTIWDTVCFKQDLSRRMQMRRLQPLHHPSENNLNEDDIRTSGSRIEIDENGFVQREQ